MESKAWVSPTLVLEVGLVVVVVSVEGVRPRAAYRRRRMKDARTELVGGECVYRLRPIKRMMVQRSKMMVGRVNAR